MTPALPWMKAHTSRGTTRTSTLPRISSLVELAIAIAVEQALCFYRDPVPLRLERLLARRAGYFYIVRVELAVAYDLNSTDAFQLVRGNLEDRTAEIAGDAPIDPGASELTYLASSLWSET